MRNIPKMEESEPAELYTLEEPVAESTEINQQSPGERAPADTPTVNLRRWGGLAGGLILAIAMYLVLPDSLAQPGKVTAAIAVLMGIWWMTEALPIPATALVPLVAFPVFADVPIKDVGASYGNDVIFLFMGGFMLALAMQRWNLHRRIALLTLKVMGPRPGAMIGGFMIATGFLSMWVSNTATAVMMLPIGMSVLLLVAKVMPGVGHSTVTETGETVLKSKFATALMLGIAYSASIGSLGTIIGTPPNTLLVGYLNENFNITIGFGQWMLVGMPLAIVFMFLAWLVLTKVLFRPEIKEIPGGRQLINQELADLGPASKGELRVLLIFVLAAVLWIGVPIVFEKPPISDAGIAMLIALLLFVLPGGSARGVRLLDWASAVQLPWGVLLLFGGGLALSAQFSSSGLTEWIGTYATGLAGLPMWLIVGIVALVILGLTELTSNTATAATFLPVAGGIALGIGADPLLLTIPVALAATCAFMLPVATPPNAVAFGSGYVTIGEMVKGGFYLNLVAIVLVTLTSLTLAVWVFGIVY
ncbi:DASS family sodium-coupled anion symporter [Scrofimicrobium sp. R131]|uniref:Sodium-dependent dicarboxylate transporter SdcS n=1 Tax=Scrofimicrobium appendicitidis TaxID=3079930 RepID=A0AAU7V4R9_9ACTO